VLPSSLVEIGCSSVSLRMKMSNRKSLGAYYTPYHAAKAMANWAIDGQDLSVLEPSFGGCKFLKACQDRFIELGCKEPNHKLYGYDIDDSAFEIHLYGNMNIRRSNKNFIKKSFLDSSLSDFNKKFDVVIGNPPYVSYHAMTSDYREKSKRICSANNINIKGNFSLWLPFIAKSLLHLKKGGKIAFVLPSALTESYYAHGLIRHLESNFRVVRIISLKERLFTEFGTEEISYCLFCEGYKLNSKKSTYTFHEVDRIENIEAALNYSNGRSTRLSHSDFLEQIHPNDKYTLGDLFNVKIGLVSGCNRFFIVSKSIVEKYSLPGAALKSIIKSRKRLSGLVINENDLQLAYQDNEDAKLLCISSNYQIEPELERYLRSLDEEFIARNRTFGKRTPWYSINYEPVPDFIMTYMSAIGPSIVINDSNSTCTNNLHRLYAYSQLSEKEKYLLAISFQTSFSQLSAEIEGKRYGSGVLKIEPTAAKQIQMLRYVGNKNIQGIRKCFHSIHKAVGNKDYLSAARLADSFFRDSYTKDLLIEIRNKLEHIRSFRYTRSTNHD
jgi:predicted RNA methylase